MVTQEILKEFASKLEISISKSSKSLSEISASLGIDIPMLEGWLRADSIPRIRTAIELAELLDEEKFYFSFFKNNKAKIILQNYCTEYIKDRKNIGILIADGPGMEKVGIMDGSLLVAVEQNYLLDGNIGFFELNGKQYCRRFRTDGETVVLVPESNTNNRIPFIVKKDDDFKILYKVITVITDL